MHECTSGELIKTAGLKMTRQRICVLDEILRQKAPFKVGQIHARMSGEMDLATVYRILAVLKAAGIIREIPGTDENHFYEMACEHHPEHPHFTCAWCGGIQCLDPLSKDREQWLKQTFSGLRVGSVRLDLSGICERCNKTKRK